jgi:VIT1/CCC1 family predicted Fe2+/Mn2+ transporter
MDIVTLFRCMLSLYLMSEVVEHSHRKERLAVDLVRNLVFGLGHGLISILGLSIGVAFATNSSRFVAVSGLISMLTGLATLIVIQILSVRTQKETYQHLIEVERREFDEHPEIERAEMKRYYRSEGFSSDETDLMINRLSLNRDRWLKAHITHVLEFIPSKTGKPVQEAAVLGAAHMAGSLITLSPYVLLPDLNLALNTSVVLTASAFLIIGAVKTIVTGKKWYTSALEFLILGMAAFAVGYITGSLLSGFA